MCHAHDAVRVDTGPRPLFDRRDRKQSKRLMGGIDALNGRIGRGTIAPAAAGIRQEWVTKFDMRSPRYTTRIGELPRVTA
ncbi:MAG: DUF4113 domain-containing protein [Alphaproteobacteria bacterium]|nr:MAG: DUF4113 domain-containing protein [Alphaproteobacteria bacterium]